MLRSIHKKSPNECYDKLQLIKLFYIFKLRNKIQEFVFISMFLIEIYIFGFEHGVFVPDPAHTFRQFWLRFRKPGAFQLERGIVISRPLRK